MRKGFCLLYLFTYWGVYSQIPTGYYDAAVGTGYTLKSQLHTIIDGHNRQSYSAVWTFAESNDLDIYYENDNTILDIYSENPSGVDPYNFLPGSNRCGNQSQEGDCYNREHSFPSSWFGGSTSSDMYTDIHHLFPTDGRVNNFRGNLPYGEVGSVDNTFLNGSLRGSARSGLGYTGTVFEPIDEFKGDLARAYFYMATRYEDVLSSWSSDMLDGSADQVFETWALDMLMAWHENDPVSQKELDRNDDAYDHQGNRNPFVDHPEWVDGIWGNGTTATMNTSETSFDFGTVEAGQSSEIVSYTVSGMDLTDDILVSVSPPFELSLDQTSWNTSVTISDASANSSSNNTVYVRFSPTVSNGQSYNEIITHTSTGATTVNVSVSGLEGQTSSGNTALALYQSFEGEVSDNWPYSPNPVEGTFTSSSDVWEVVSSLNSIAALPSEGSQFFGGQDIENDDNPNLSFATLSFESVDVSSNINVQISFDYEVVGFDTDDIVEYSIDGGSTYADLVVGASNTNASGTEVINVSDATSTVDFIIKVAQNGGSDYCGFDNFSIVGGVPTVAWDGSEGPDWFDPDNWDTGQVPTSADDVVIANVGSLPEITGDALTSNLTIHAAATLKVNSGSSLAIFGSVDGSGLVTIERNTTGEGGYSIIGSPITVASISDLSPDYSYEYDGGFSPYNGAMTPGEGYFVGFDEAAPKISFVGTPNSGNIEYSVSTGFQLIANPYAAPITIDAFQETNVSTFDGTVYFWDDAGSNNGTDRAGSYITVNDLGTVGTVDLGGSGQGTTPASNSYITSAQGVFVNVTSTSSPIQFTPSMQTTVADANADANHYRTEAQIIRLSLSNEDKRDDMIIGLVDGATLEQDFALDALKFTESSSYLYSIQGEVSYAIQALPPSDYQEISIGMEIPAEGGYLLSADFENLSNQYTVYLFDNLTETRYDLSFSGEVNLSLAAGKEQDRFLLIISSQILGERSDKKIIVYPNPTSGQLHFDGAFQGSISAFLYDTSGQKITAISDATKEKVEDHISHILSAMNNGSYFLTVLQDQEKWYFKVQKGD